MHAGSRATGDVFRQPGGASWAVRHAVLIALCTAIPAGVLPTTEPALAALAMGAGYAVGCGFWLRAEATDLWTGEPRAGSGESLRFAVAVVGVYATALLVLVMVALPLALILWPLSPALAAAIIAVASALLVPRQLFALPALAAGDDLGTALDRGWTLVDAAPLRTSLGTVLALAAAVGPAMAAAGAAAWLGEPAIVQRIAAIAALAVAGWVWPAWMAGWTGLLDERRRRSSPSYARP